MTEKKKETKTTPANEEPIEASVVTEEEDASMAMTPYTQALTVARTTLMDELTVLRDKADGDDKALLQRLCRACDPVKKGREEISNRWSLPTIRIVQNMTKDKPEGSKVGDLYTSSGATLKTPFKCTPLYIYEVNRMFPAQGMKAPVCIAPDAKLGNTFGACDKCINLPLGKNATNQSTDCDNGVCFIVLGENMRMYRLEFFRTSKKAGNKIVNMTEDWDNIWEQWVSVGSKEVSNDAGNSYHIFTVGAHGDIVAPALQEAIEVLYDMVIAERKARLKEHWDAAMSGDKAAGDVDESIDADKVEVTDGSDNPDLAGKF